MCGITGILHPRSSRPVDREVLLSMTRSIAHRGPDGEGLYLEERGGLGLGHRRLSIIDLEGGAQPMRHGSDLVVVYNGEIYNFRELRADLEAKGAVFHTRSDTEVLLQLYAIEGEDGFERLNGIFAFAIWDRPRRRLVAARDQLGVKPFYWYQKDDLFLFGSEIKALLAHPEVSADVDEEALEACLALRYVPSPSTLFAGIKKLPPGHRLIVELGSDTAESRPPRISRFWRTVPVIDPEIEYDRALDGYAAKLEAAVRRQMVSDVPIGVMLSGGIDSGVVASIMARARKESGGPPVQSFTIGFEGGERTNETGEAARTAEILGLVHKDVIVSAKDYEAFFQEFIWHQEEPSGNESAPAAYFVSKLARSEVKVLLAGQGADEPLAGYDRYKGERYSEPLRLLPSRLRSALPRVAGRVARNEKLRRSLESLGEPDTARRFLAIYSIYSPAMQEELWRDSRGGEAAAVARLLAPIEALRRPLSHLDPLSQMLAVDTRMWLPDDLLTVADKMTMAVSLELRVPFLDVELIEYIERLPPSFKLHRLSGKRIHKDACRRWLPREVLERKKKGFANPVDRWMRKELVGLFDSLIADPSSLAQRYFDAGFIEQLARADREGTADYKRQLFLLLSLELWNRRFISRRASP